MANQLLTSLTPDQERQLPVIRDHWLSVGLSTEPADRAEAERGVRLAYRAARLEEPSLFVWLSSPMAGVIGAAFLKQMLQRATDGRGDQVRDQVRAQVGAQVWDQVSGQVRDQVKDQVKDQVWDQVSGQVWAQVWDQVRAQVRVQVRAQVSGQVWAQVWDQVMDQVRAQVKDQVWDQVRAQVGAAGYGQHDANWIGFYEAIGRFGIDVSRIDGLRVITSNAGWWWPFRGLCILTDRPKHLHRDADGRLHAETAAALQYRDEWGIYAWHGVRVSEAIILRPNSITVEQIQQEQNAEVRRVMMTRYGEDRYIRDIGAIPIHSDETGDLYRVEVPGDEPLVMVRVINSTPESDGSKKPYWLRVPPDMTQARQAVAWTFSMSAADYAPQAES